MIIQETKAIIFCGGLGTRAETITGNKIPKHLLPISRTQTILDHSVITARRAGIKDVNLIVSDNTAKHIYDHKKRNFETYEGVSMFDHGPLISGGAIGLLQLWLANFDRDSLLVKLDGDELNLGFDLSQMLEIHKSAGHGITYMTTKSADQRKYELTVNDQRKVTRAERRIENKSDHAQWNLSSLFIMEPCVTGILSESVGTLDFLQSCVNLNKLYIYPNYGHSININTQSDYLKIRSLY